MNDKKLKLRQDIEEDRNKRETKSAQINLNKDSFMVPSKLERIFPVISQFFARNHLNLSSFKHMMTDGGQSINAAMFEQFLASHGIQGCRYFLTVKNGKISSQQLDSFLKETKLNDAVDSIQRRKRYYIPKSQVSAQAQEVTRSQIQGQSVDHKKEFQSFTEHSHRKSKSALKLFRTYDIDGDGFISREEFLTSVDQQKSLCQEGAQAVYSQIDQQNKGYITFGDFAKVRSFSTEIVPSVLPSEQNHRVVKEKAAEARLKRETEQILKQEALLDFNKQIKVNTRTSARPPYLFKNTFDSVMPTQQSRGPQDSLDSNSLYYQVEDKLRKAERLRAVGEKIKKSQERVQQVVDRENARSFYSEARQEQFFRAARHIQSPEETLKKLREFS